MENENKKDEELKMYVLEKRKTNDKDVTQWALYVSEPNQCPFRKNEKCYLVFPNYEIFQSCNVEFVIPCDCPLNVCDIIVV